MFKRRRRWWIAPGVVAGLVMVWWVAVAGDHAVPIDSYRVVNDRTLVVVAGGSNAREWCRVTDVTGTTLAVTIAARCLEFLPLPGAGVGKEVELTAQLGQPLGARVVVNDQGSPIDRARCINSVCSAVPSSGVVPSFSLTTSEGTIIPVRGAADCAELADSWLRVWCRDLVDYRAGAIPTKLEPNQRVDQAMVQLIYAGLAWAVLQGDDTICDNPLVGAFLSFTAVSPPAPTPFMSPSQRCRNDLATTRAQSQTHGHTFSVVSQDSRVEVRVGLPGGKPLPTPAAS